MEKVTFLGNIFEEFQINSVILSEIKLLHRFNIELINQASEKKMLVDLSYCLPHGQA